MSSHTSEAPPKATPGAAEESKPADYVGAGSWLVSGISFAALIGFSFLNKFTYQSGWLVPLFALPLAGQTIGSLVLFHRPRGDKRLRTFHRFYLWLMILCIGSYFAMWLCYLLWILKVAPLSAKTLSAVSLAAITLLVSMVGLMTLAILRPPARSQSSNGGRFRSLFSNFARWIMDILRNLRMGASQEPFLASLLFFNCVFRNFILVWFYFCVSR